MICERCERPAEFIYPQVLCGDCWCRWWAGMDEDLPGMDDKETLYQEAKSLVKKQANVQVP